MSIDIDEDVLRVLDAERVTVSRQPSGRLGADVLRETLPDDLRDATERIGHIAYDLENYRP